MLSRFYSMQARYFLIDSGDEGHLTSLLSKTACPNTSCPLYNVALLGLMMVSTIGRPPDQAGLLDPILTDCQVALLP